MKYFITMAMLLLLAAGALFAQGFNGGNAGATATTIMLKIDNAVYALRSGVLVKNDATTLKQLGELQLFSPAPAMPPIVRIKQRCRIIARRCKNAWPPRSCLPPKIPSS